LCPTVVIGFSVLSIRQPLRLFFRSIMSKGEPQGPLEQLPKQIQDLLKGSPFSSVFGNQGVPSGVQAGGSTPENADENAQVLEKIRHFSLRPREIRDYLDR